MANRPSLNRVGEITPPVAFSSDTEQGKDSGGALRRDPLPASASGGEGSRSIPEQWLGRPRRCTVSLCAVCWSPIFIVPKILFRRRCLPRLKVGGDILARPPSEPGSLAFCGTRPLTSAGVIAGTIGILRMLIPWLKATLIAWESGASRPSGWTPNPQSLVESQEFWAIFHSCMGALPERTREAFALRVVEGLDASETCRILDITSANLWTLLYRARERLRRCLEGKWFTKGER